MVTLREKFRGCIAATAADLYTNNKRTIHETADGLLGAFTAGRRRLADHVTEMTDPAYLGQA